MLTYETARPAQIRIGGPGENDSAHRERKACRSCAYLSGSMGNERLSFLVI